MDSKNWHKSWARIVAKAWADADYKQRLLTDFEGVMKDEGVDLPPDMEFKVIDQKNENHWVLVLPPPPENIGQVEDVASRMVASAQCCCCCTP
ncbi:nitrile hydratase subunit alpha [Dethiosulfatarculus sandiegensis]|uniref:Nitrile hydratase n=1 Tax=Dethiosulfatarculus sandiegensis TaxID=1429043 RepID=A0A0D2JX28_9BACT|nr:nitrile hydratase subunit alpha [Dethiosulfatarculus sandiegensis]KIX14130.1 nitrile hydratase [Dethiosulfatarculus sandiegensis]